MAARLSAIALSSPAAWAAGPEPARQLPGDSERGGELRRDPEVRVHRPHRQRDGEHRGRVAARTAEAHGDEVCERHARIGIDRDADGRDRKADVEHRDNTERNGDRARQLDLGPAELAQGRRRHERMFA